MHYFLKTVLFVASVLLFFSYIAYSIPSRPSLPPEEGKIDFAAVQTKDDLVALGQKLFFGKGQCALCHSIGHSETARCPDLEGIGAKLTREFIYESLTKPDAFIYKQYEYSPPKPFAAQMPQIHKDPIGLSENELLAVIAFIQSTGGSEYVTVEPTELVKPREMLVAQGDSEKGAAIYKDLGCVQCHGEVGKESKKGIPHLTVLTGKKDPLYFIGMLQTDTIPEHRGLDVRLSVKGLNDLMTYLMGIKPKSETL